MNLNTKEVASWLEVHLASSEQMWTTGVPHAQIIGYLQGVIKNTITELNNHNNQ